jgi:ParB family chromosome partitioning protein
MEEARAYRHLMETLGLSQQDVADKVGKKRSTVANSLRLLKLPENMRKAVEAGSLSAGHARALLAVTNPADQELLFSKIVNQSLSVRDAEAAATEMNRGHKGSETATGSKNTRTQDRDPEMDNLEQRFIEVLGTKVSLKGNLSRGRMEISWFNRDDLDRIYELLISEENE